MTNSIVDIFAASPVMPIEEHMGLAKDCAEQLQKFFEAVSRFEWDEAEKIRDEIVRLEEQADSLKQDIRKRLTRRSFMPVARQDLIGMLLSQDEIANVAREVSSLVLVRKMPIPDAIQEDFLQFVEVNISAVKQTQTSVKELDELFASNFRGAEAKLVDAMLDKLDSIETGIEGRLFDLQSKLHAIEDSLDPVSIVFTYQLIARIADIAYSADRVGQRLELLIS